MVTWLITMAVISFLSVGSTLYLYCGVITLYCTQGWRSAATLSKRSRRMSSARYSKRFWTKQLSPISRRLCSSCNRIHLSRWRATFSRFRLGLSNGSWTITFVNNYLIFNKKNNSSKIFTF